jgi:hypothetical protein
VLSVQQMGTPVKVFQLAIPSSHTTLEVAELFFVSEYDLETSRMKRSWPKWGRSTKGQKNFSENFLFK